MPCGSATLNIQVPHLRMSVKLCNVQCSRAVGLDHLVRLYLEAYAAIADMVQCELI